MASFSIAALNHHRHPASALTLHPKKLGPTGTQSLFDRSRDHMASMELMAAVSQKEAIQTWGIYYRGILGLFCSRAVLQCVHEGHR
jgi:hypothetical protein